MTLTELRALNADCKANRSAIIAYLQGDPALPSEHASLIEIARMAVMASGYEQPALSAADQKKFLRLSIAAAERALQVDPNAASSHYWFAVNRALDLKVEGFFATLFGLGKVRSSAQRSVEIDEKENSAGPLRIRAMLEFNLPGVLGGDKSRALADLNRAMELFPKFRENHLFLAQVQAKVSGKDAAIATLQLGLATPASFEPELESRWEREMKALLATLTQS